MPDSNASADSDAFRTIRLVTYNIHGCIGTDGRLAPQRIACVLAQLNPDIVALQEVDVGRRRSGLRNQACEIASELSMQWEFHAALRIQEEQYGNAVLSRYPLRPIRAAALPERIPRPAEPRGALWVEIAVGDRMLHVVTTHLGLTARERLRQVDELLGPEWLGAATDRGPVILCGDLNSVAWSAVYRRLARRLRDAAACSANRPSPTFHSRFPLVRIDHVFTTDTVQIVGAAVLRTVETVAASDHLPLVVDFQLLPTM